VRERRQILWLVGLVVAVVAAFVLSAVIKTIVIAIATSYVLLPLHRWISRRGLKPYWSAITATLIGLLATLLVATPIGFVLYFRREIIAQTLQTLNGKLTLTVVNDQPIVLDLTAIREAIVPSLSGIAVSIAESISALSAKFIVFAFVVFALLYYYQSMRALVFGPVPAAYHGIAEQVHERIREVLLGHYVLVLAGGAVTYVFGLALFVGLNYQIPYFLALVGAVLWILPFISAAPLVLALTITHALSGELTMAVTIGVLGAVFLVAAPNAAVELVRDRLGNPARLDQTLYFVGFVGGGLTIGLVGLVVGPLVLAVLTTLVGEFSEQASEPVS
jgi:predicted PurR-regulated permease PerM